MSLQDRVRHSENELTGLLLLLLGLYDKGIVDKSRYLELANNLTRSAAKDVKVLVDRDAAARGLPPSDDDLAAIALLLQRVGKDMAAQIDDFDTDPEGVKTRIQQTATFVPWSAYAESIKDIAQKTGARVMWNTMLDEMVCEVCAPRHGVIYELGQVPPIPAHANCRCWLSLV